MPVAASLYYYAYLQEGQMQTPVVLIHGAGGTHLQWSPQLRRLPGYRVFALDLPGHGKSGGRGLQSIQGYADAVVEWLQALGLWRAVFVGHSMGGAIALTLALDHPQHVSRLALVSTGARLRVHAAILDNAASESTYLNAVQTIIEWAFSSQAPPRMVELAAKRMAETRASVLYGDFLACNDFDVSERLAEIHHSTLVVCGVEDRMAPLRYSQFLAEHIPNAHLEIIPNAGHMVILEQPQAVANALLTFLSRR